MLKSVTKFHWKFLYDSDTCHEILLFLVRERHVSRNHINPCTKSHMPRNTHISKGKSRKSLFIQNSLKIINLKLNSRFGALVGNDLSNKIYTNYLNQSYIFHINKNSSELNDLKNGVLSEKAIIAIELTAKNLTLKYT